MKRIYLILFPLSVTGAVFLYFFNPETTMLAPKCLFHGLTGLECPACGGQRALHALLHGQWSRALAFNPFLALAVPYALLVVLADAFKIERLRRWVLHRRVVYSYVVVFVVWWIVRNL